MLYYKDVKTLIPSKKVETWMSENPFYASVDKDGTVTAEHVGETYVAASTEGFLATCKVTVSPKLTLYTEPFASFGESMNYIKSKEEGTLISSTETRLIYKEGDEAVLWYLFEDGELDMVVVLLDFYAVKRDDIFNFLSERYQPISVDDNVTLFIDNCITKAKLVVSFEYDVSKDYIGILYRPYTETKTKSENKVLAAEMSKQLKDLLKK